ncbi:MAG: TIGR03086 family metal-binding protein [Actinomycetota bacterium]
MDVNMYERALKTTGEIVAGTKPEQLDDPTPCNEWTVRELLNHMIGGCVTWAMGAAGEAGDISPSVDRIGDDHVKAYEEASRNVLDAFSSSGAMEKNFTMPWGESPGKANLDVAVSDITVHGCDLAEATGQEISVDDDIAEACYQWTTGMMEPKGSMPRRGAFAEPVEVPDDAPPLDRLLGYLGREPIGS